MRNIFLFIRRFSVFIAFLVVQGICLYLLFTYQRFHRAKGLGIASNVTGYFNAKYNAVEDFFNMKAENKRIHAMNDSLLNLLKQNFVPADTAVLFTKDSLAQDTTGMRRQYKWRAAQVLYTTVNSDKNYLQINKGRAEGVADDMGVFSSNGGLVGKVVNTTEHYSEVMTLLHVLNKLSIKMQRTGSTGMLEWEGQSPKILTVTGIPKTDSVKVGDSIVTGNYSLSYPQSQMVGTVSAIVKNVSTNFLVLQVKPTANFGSLQQVFVVENLGMEAQKLLNESTRKKVEASSKK